jgi:hypothetical protein
MGEEPLYAGNDPLWVHADRKGLRYILEFPRYGEHGDRGSAISAKSTHYGVHADTESTIAP